MEQRSVTSKGQVTIPEKIRRKLGIRAGSRVSFRLVDGHVEMQPVAVCPDVPESGFAMLRSKKKAVPADFDVASLAQKS